MILKSPFKTTDSLAPPSRGVRAGVDGGAGRERSGIAGAAQHHRCLCRSARRRNPRTLHRGGKQQTANRPELTAAIQLRSSLVPRGSLPNRTGFRFLLTLRDNAVCFLAVDMPEANDPTVSIMALVARRSWRRFPGEPRRHSRLPRRGGEIRQSKLTWLR